MDRRRMNRVTLGFIAIVVLILGVSLLSEGLQQASRRG